MGHCFITLNITKSLDHVCIHPYFFCFTLQFNHFRVQIGLTFFYLNCWYYLECCRVFFENKKFNYFAKCSDSNIKNVNTFIAGSLVEFVNISDGTACLFVNSAVSVHPWQFCYHSLRPSCLCICMDMSCHLRTIVSSGEC